MGPINNKTNKGEDPSDSPDFKNRVRQQEEKIRKRKKRRSTDKIKKTRRDRRGPGVSPRHIHAEVLHMPSPPECFSSCPSLLTGKVPWQTKLDRAYDWS